MFFSIVAEDKIMCENNIYLRDESGDTSTSYFIESFKHGWSIYQEMPGITPYFLEIKKD